MNCERSFYTIYRAEIRYFAKGRRPMKVDGPHYGFQPIAARESFDGDGRGIERDASDQPYAVIQVSGEANVVDDSSGMLLSIDVSQFRRRVYDNRVVRDRLIVSAQEAMEFARRQRYGLSIVNRG